MTLEFGETRLCSQSQSFLETWLWGNNWMLLSVQWVSTFLSHGPLEENCVNKWDLVRCFILPQEQNAFVQTRGIPFLRCMKSPFLPSASLLYLNSSIHLAAWLPLLVGRSLLLCGQNFLFYHLALISTLIFWDLLIPLQYCIEFTIQSWNIILRMRHGFLTCDSLLHITHPQHPSFPSQHSFKKTFLKTRAN